MKKLILTACFALAFSLCANAQVRWQTIEEVGQTDVSKNERMFLVDFSTSWCGWCKKMDKETFGNDMVMAILNHYYYSVHFDAETPKTFTWNGKEYANPNPKAKKGSPHSFTRAILGAQIGYPSIAVFNQKMNLVQVLQGYQNADEMVKFLCFFVNDNYMKYSYQKYMAIFDTQILPGILEELKLN